MDKYYLAALTSVFTYLPAINLWELMAKFGSAQNIYSLNLATLKATGLIPSPLVKRYKERYKASLPDDLAEYCQQHKVDLVDFHNKNYPLLLRHVANPPPVLYVKGKIPAAGIFLAMVGSRSATDYGLTLARDFAKKLSLRNLVIVSGGAYGIDAASHKGALEGSGSTVAVIGSGFDNLYPACNKKLFWEVQEKGALVTEFAPDIEPLSKHFPLRNRIIAGMCHSILVVEAAQRSGAIITAGIALEEGRDVYAIPGDITAGNSKGTNRLIQDGAKLITCPEDVLAEFALCTNKIKKAKVENVSLFTTLPPKEEKDTERVFALIGSRSSVTIDEIVLASGVPVQKLAGILLKLQLKGFIALEHGNRYRRI